MPPNFTYFWKASLVETSCWIDFNVSKNSLNENGYITNSTYLPAKYVESSPDNNFAFEPVI